MKGRKILILIIIIFSVLLSSFSFYAYQVIKTPNILVQQDDTFIYIYPGTTFKQLQDSLYHKGIVHDLISFSMLAKFKGYDKNIRPGRYLLKSEMNNIEAIDLLRSGNQVPVNITFNNVRLVSELAEKICANIALPPEEFNQLLADSVVIESYGFNQENFLSMFIPNTYEVYWDISAAVLMDRIYYEYQNFWDEKKKEKARSIGLSPKEVSVLASIVHAESQQNDDELPRIAGLYMNRLDRNMALQADPTLVYAAGDFTIRRVLNEHREIDSPYNTYMYTGLPPGPIRAPSIAAIMGVLDSETHNYLYMCAKEDFSGSHNFASSLSQHLRNARLYQNALNKAKLYR
ncbi:MAG: endolytic transglycosylase MltG [Bacteroidetes bacterium]|nr:MAG: endolytic transglycosylase MltG [Bacteroidota bacterium]